jgi:hypothetical protein
VTLRLALPAVALVLLVSACGGGHERRDSLQAYITQVNATQVKMRKPLLQVERAYRDFGRKKGPTLTALEPRLAQSATTMRALEKKLRALHPPPDAKRLHGLIVQLVHAEGEIADEVVLLAQFAPRFSRALTPLAPAGRNLRDAFKGAKTAKAQAVALDAYAAALAGVLERLRPLEAPPAFAPALSSQRSTLAQVRTSAIELADGLRKNRRVALPTLIQRFTNAGLANQGLAAQKARIAAIKAYNRRVAHLVTLARKVDRERLRLERQLG